MKEKEKQLFKAVCKFKDKFEDPSLIEFATPAVLGHLFFNRMQGVAYDVLKNNGLTERSTVSFAIPSVQHTIKTFKRTIASRSVSLCSPRSSLLVPARLLCSRGHICALIIPTVTGPRMTLICSFYRKTLPQSVISSLPQGSCKVT